MAITTSNGKAKGPGGAKKLVIKPLKRETGQGAMQGGRVF